jgi:D-alanine-D-alanine ligase
LEKVIVTDKRRVGIIFGGRSGEHEVSLASARSVLSALDQNKYAIVEIGITHEGQWFTGENTLELLAKNDTSSLNACTIFADPTKPGLYILRDTGEKTQVVSDVELDVVFPVLHGTYGEDGTLQGLLELANLAYVGAGVLGSSVGMDKDIFKRVMVAHNIPVVDWIVVQRSEIKSDMYSVIERILSFAPYPLFIKPANLGSSVGITKCRTKSDLIEGLLEAARFDRRVLVERGINAREIEVSVLGNDKPMASIPGEIRPEADFYSYEAKYNDSRSELLIPAPIPHETAEEICKLAVEAYTAIDCAGMARVDFLFDKDNGNLYLNEINTIPGFTQISMYPKLWEATGLSYPDLLDRLIELALERKTERSDTEHRI